MKKFALALIVAIVALNCLSVEAGIQIGHSFKRPVGCRDHVEKLSAKYAVPSELKEAVERVMRQNNINNIIYVDVDAIEQLGLSDKDKKKLVKAAISFDSKTEKAIFTVCDKYSWKKLRADVYDMYEPQEYLKDHPAAMEFVAYCDLAALIKYRNY